MSKNKVDKQKNIRYSNFWSHVAAVIFALFMVFGRSFEKTDSVALVLGSPANKLLSVVQGVAWYFVFFVVIFYLFRLLDRIMTPHKNKNKYNYTKENSGLICAIKMLCQKYLAQLDRRPVQTVFCTLFLVNIPYMVLSYPGIFMGDTVNQIAQGLGINPFINHHPVVHTLTISLFWNIGAWLGNENIGIFLLSLTQTVLLLAVIAYAIGTLVEINANRILIGGIVFYYCIHPRIFSYLFLITKDVLYSAFFILFYVLLFKLLQDTNPKKKWDYAFFTIAIIGMIAFRNDGKYIVLLTMLFALLYKKFRRTGAMYLGVAVLVSAAIGNILLPLLNAEPGSVREMLSVPFQQTARYVRDAGTDISKEEIAVIDKVLDYESLASKYKPNISDPIKGTYHGTDEALKEYFSVWFQMFWRHPGIYVQATMNNYYQYFYPGKALLGSYTYDWGAQCMEKGNERLQADCHFPERLDGIRKAFESLREDTFNLTVLSLLKTPALYTWMAMLFIFYCLRRKSLLGIIYSIPIFIHLLILITGPTNGYYCRYEYPMLIYLPIVIVLGLKLMENQGSKIR